MLCDFTINGPGLHGYVPVVHPVSFPNLDLDGKHHQVLMKEREFMRVEVNMTAVLRQSDCAAGCAVVSQRMFLTCVLKVLLLHGIMG